MSINRQRGKALLEKFNFTSLFIDEIGWSSVPAEKPMPIGDSGCNRRLIAQLEGIHVLEVYPQKGGALPDSGLRGRIHTQIERQAYHNILIFLDDDKKRSQSVVYWVKRDDGKKRPRAHPYFRGQTGDLMLSKLDALVVEMEELLPDGGLPLRQAAQKVAAALDIQAITKSFFSVFRDMREDFINWIEGIDAEGDRGWYASVLLNRLMFIYFLQKKAFIGGDANYLENKLDASRQRGQDRFYRDFLDALFFEGFAKPERDRSPAARALLGSGIPYLNGGLFIRHKLELEHSAIHIPDAAFAEVLALFGKYSWYLNDAPGAADNEINPDVLGYIFEKYINQKAFGAYYTRKEITEYLCERSIRPVILAEVNRHSRRQFKSFGDMLEKLDSDLCRTLLFTVLPKLSVLDPACGSGAFLVAAMQDLLDVYGAAYGKIEMSNEPDLKQHFADIKRRHPSLLYYYRKRIISHNLYGVDIMEEAAEIAKLRLFLALVGAADTADQLEPLPNIDFNIMSGNSLIGLLTVDEKRFDARQQQDFLQLEESGELRQALEEKNNLVKIYRETTSLDVDLTKLRGEIDAHKAEAQVTLDEILLDDFQTLKIQYEQARLKGRPVKRPLETSDIAALKPFHWGYEFDEILETRGGFDVIITNPPWDIVQPDEKEFFQQYDETITKRMDNRQWRERRAELMQRPGIQQAWLDYRSKFAHLKRYFKTAPQYRNQKSVMNGRNVSGKNDLYKVFCEQCFNLLREGGACGMVIPSGFYTDLRSKQIRELLFSATVLNGLFAFENRDRIFDGVHRSFKIVALTYVKGGRTNEFPAAFMRRDVNELADFPAANSIELSVDLIRRSSPASLSITEFKSELDVQLTEKMLSFPFLGETLPSLWNVKFRHEFMMTNDSDLFKYEPAPGRLPLYEGKMIWQFEHRYSSPRYWIEEQEGRQRVLGRKTSDTGQLLGYQMYRLGFRDVASSTNKRTGIATILPRSFFASETIRLEKVVDATMTTPHRLYLCSCLNSFVVDSWLRNRVTSHVTFYFVYQLPIPRLMPGDLYFDAIVSRAARLICTAPAYDDLAAEVGLGDHRAGVTNPSGRATLRAELDGMIGRIYGLTEAEFKHILSTFPNVAGSVRAAALNAFRDLG